MTQLPSPPAATTVTSVNPAGDVDSPWPLYPQATSESVHRAGVEPPSTLEEPELPPLLYARARYEYVVPGQSPVLRRIVAFDNTCAICVKFVPSAERSILNPSSLVDASLQPRLIWKEDTTVATRLVGGLGIVCAHAPLNKSRMQRTTKRPANRAENASFIPCFSATE